MSAIMRGLLLADTMAQGGSASAPLLSAAGAAAAAAAVLKPCLLLLLGLLGMVCSWGGFILSPRGLANTAAEDCVLLAGLYFRAVGALIPAAAAAAAGALGALTAVAAAARLLPVGWKWQDSSTIPSVSCKVNHRYHISSRAATSKAEGKGADMDKHICKQ
jgi:hypothetical protein